MPGNDVMQYFEPVVLPVSRLWAIVANQNSPDSARAKSTCALGGSTAVPRAGRSRFLSFCFSLFFLFLFYFSRFCCSCCCSCLCVPGRPFRDNGHVVHEHQAPRPRPGLWPARQQECQLVGGSKHAAKPQKCTHPLPLWNQLHQNKNSRTPELCRPLKGASSSCFCPARQFIKPCARRY